MQILNQNMPADFINSDYWPQIRKNLLDVMTEPEDSLTVWHSLLVMPPQSFDFLTVLNYLSPKKKTGQLQFTLEKYLCQNSLKND